MKTELPEPTTYETAARERDLYMMKPEPKVSIGICLLFATVPVMAGLMGLGVVKLIEWIF